MRKGLAKILTVLFLLSLIPITSFAAGFEAYALDTIAGYSTFLKTSQTTPNKEVVFEVKKPSGEAININAVTNQNGVAQAEFSDYYTSRAGVYSVAAKFSNGSLVGNRSTFTVFPGDVSTYKSTLTPADQLANLSEEIKLTASLLDDFGNPISGHQVKLVSSSGGDHIEAIKSSVSDSAGRVSFIVSSDSPGASSYAAYDVTADMILEARAKVAYFESANSLFRSTPSNYAFAASGAGSGAIDGFEFTDLPESIAAGQSFTFTVNAVDALSQTVVDYQGVVRFSVASNNFASATLPSDYQFTVLDQGSHTFSLAMSFMQPGTYDVEVRDLANTSVFGAETINVSTASLSSTAGAILSGTTITNPVPGTYSNNIQVVSGKTDAGATLKIFDNDFEIGSAVADVTGAFSFTTSLLTDGLHSFYVARVNGVGTIVETSDAVGIQIDTSSPELSQVVIDPDGTVAPGELVNVRVYTQENLSSAALVFEGNIYDMTDSGQGFYEGSFSAPIEFGEYPMTFVVVDQLGNESKFENSSTLVVGVAGSSSGNTLADVAGLAAVSSDHRITLSWVPPVSSINPIANYRVFYGISPNQLTEAVDTFTNSTTWYLPNLKNGLNYYFAVVAVDSLGNISPHLSNIVSATPNPDVVEVVPPDVASGAAGGDILMEMESDVSETGPEIFWVLLLSIIGGFFYAVTSKRRAFQRD